MRARRIVQGAALIAIACASISCDGGTTDPPDPSVILLSGSSLSFQGIQDGADPAPQTISISNSGGGSLSWTASASAPWVTLAPASGNAPTSVTVGVNSSGLSAGTHTATITVSATGASNSPATLAVSLTLDTPPEIGLSATTFAFTGQTGGSEPEGQTLTISNTGGGTLDWSATDDASWLTLSATSGTAPSTVTLNVTMAGLSAGTYSGTITLTASDASNSPVTVEVTLAVTETYDGIWSGETAQDSVITFQIEDSGITQLSFSYNATGSGCTVGGPLTTTFTTPISVAGGSFSYTSSSSLTSYTITGNISGSSASGTLAVTYSQSIPGLPPCNASANTTWTATKGGIDPGPATKLAFLGQPSAVATAQTMVPAVQVVVQDEQGITVTGSTANITLAITSGTGTGGAVLGGTLTRQAVGGVATFSDLTLDLVGTGYTLTATASGLTTSVSTPFNVTTGTGGHSGDFLAWTGSSDPSHAFTLVRVNGQTGSVTTIGGSDFFTALAYGPSGTLYGISDELHVINPADGSSVQIGSFMYGGASVLMGAATFSPAGTLYVMESGGSSRVFTADLANAGLTLVGAPAALVSGLAFDGGGTLYGAFASLFTLSPTTLATLSTVGTTPAFISVLALGASGTMYAMDRFPSTQLYSLNLGDASANGSVALGSQGLVSLVEERGSAAAPAEFRRSAATRGLAPSPSTARLLDRERVVTARRNALLRKRGR